MKPLLLVCLVVGALNCNAQIVYGETLGNSVGWYTVNYEHLLSDEGKNIWSMHAGVGLYNVSDAYAHKSFPVGVTYYNKKSSNHHKEIGLCLNYVEGLSDNSQDWVWQDIQYSKALVAIPNFGYRYQKPSGGLLFKLYYAPVIVIKEFEDPPYYFNRQMLWTFNFGISMGYSF